MDQALACNSRIQRLLWTEEYFSLTDEVVLLESAFVLNVRHGSKIRMVQVGLTSSVLLIAEDKLPSVSPANRAIQRPARECNSDIELFELIYLFPLGNVRLSVRTHSDEIGERVMRVRLCSGSTWYLELSDPRHREDKWHEWVWWIQELEQRRRSVKKEERRRHRVAFMRGKMSSGSLIKGNLGSIEGQGSNANLQSAADTGIRSVNSGIPTTSTRNKQHLPVGAANRSALGRPTRRKQSTAHRWVHHFAEHMIDHHNEDLNGDDDDDDDDAGHMHGHRHSIKSGRTPQNTGSNPLFMIDHSSSRKLSEQSSSVWGESHGSLTHSSSHVRSSRSKVKGHPGRHGPKGRMMLSVLDVVSGEDSMSSLEDIQSVGSIVSSNAESWTNRHARDTRLGLLFCLGDLFGKVNFEAHAHGHTGRTRPMASMTRLDVLLEDDPGCPKSSDEDVFNIDKAQLHHTASVPDILEGEASFLEDLPNADDVTHRLSLVYLDLENEDDSRSPHVVNGHVMFLTRQQLDLHHEIEKIRNKELDPRMKYEIHTKNKEQLPNSLNKKGQNKFDSLVTGSTKNSSQQLRPGASKGKWKSIFFVGRPTIQKLSVLDESPFERRYETLSQVESSELANELTAIDAELCLRIHEAELVGCMWLKEDRVYRAPNVVRAVQFFKRIARRVTAEVLLPVTSSQRASTVVHFLNVAESLRANKNFHSLRAIVAGLQSPAVYRLQDTWKIVEEQHDSHFETWQQLLELANDEDRSLSNDPELDEAMKSPPCLPFLGSVLMRIIDFYTTFDLNGTRIAHKLYDHDHNQPDTNTTSSESDIEIVDGIVTEKQLDENDEKECVESKMTETRKTTFKVLELFKSAGQKLHTLGSKQHRDVTSESEKSTRTGTMSAERKHHICRLIIEYAQLVAEELERERYVDASVARSKRKSDDIKPIDSALRAKLLENFMGDNDVNVDDDDDEMKRQRSRHFSELHEMAHAHDEAPWKHAWTSEYHLHETLLHFQLSVAKYEPRQRNQAIRNLLLQEFTELEFQQFKLSLEREPPN